MTCYSYSQLSAVPEHERYSQISYVPTSRFSISAAAFLLELSIVLRNSQNT